MIDGNLYRTLELNTEQDEEYIKAVILSVLKEKKVSMSQAFKTPK